MTHLPGLPGGPPYERRPRIQTVRSALLIPERVARAAQSDNPITQYIRAMNHVKWGFALVRRDL